MRRLAATLLAMLAVPAAAQEPGIVAEVVTAPDTAVARPLVIAHRGASGERPEHTLAAYERALDQGADWLETDLVPTLDGVLVARHESELSQTTDVADRPEFTYRKTTKIVDGEELTGWFAEDFTLAELRALHARERMPRVRPANARFDGVFAIPTLGELLRLMRAKEAELGRPVSLLLELKHPTYFADLGHDLAALTLAELGSAGYGGGDPRIVFQSFEVGVLCRLRQAGRETVQLIAPSGGPPDVPGVTYRSMIDPAGLASLSRCADALGAPLGLVLEPDGTAAPLMAAARGAGMPVYAWTVRRENAFLPAALRRGEGESAIGDLRTLADLLTVAGVAGIITDNPADVVALQQAGAAGE